MASSSILIDGLLAESVSPETQKGRSVFENSHRFRTHSPAVYLPQAQPTIVAFLANPSPAHNKQFNMKCEECEDEAAQTHCEACGQFLCLACDLSLHKKGKRQAHIRGPVCASCEPERPCMACLLGPVPTQKTPVTVYWEMNCLYPKSQEEAKAVLSAITEAYGPPKEVRAYAQNFLKLGTELRGLGFELVTREGVSDYQSLIMDISLKSREPVPGKLLVLSAGAGRLKSFLCELGASLPKECVLVANCLDPLRFLSPEEMQTPASYTITSRVKPISHDYRVTKPGLRVETKESVPLFQVWSKKIVTGGIADRLMDFLKSYANQGKIMTEVNALVSGFQHYAIVKAEQAKSAVQSVVSTDLIHTTNRSFGSLKTVTFVSLKADSLSLELLLWTLRSLKNDEMLPTERAIQSRMKEAFDFKPTQVQWQQLLDAVVERSKHQHSFSAPDVTHFRGAGNTRIDLPAYTIPNFLIAEVVDSLTNQETKVVYPEGEKWVALDNNLKPSDGPLMKESEQWTTFVSFLENYFSPDDAKRVWRRAEEDKAISGGRYGCAQFLKFCGPALLQSCSLGRLSFMVQLAINEDLLRYQKTLLVWTSGTAKPTNEEVTAEKLRQVQNAVLEALKESPDGVSLAQLPMKVRSLLNFPLDLCELGFAKLKDLLATIPTVKIELRGSNHPFAIYVAQAAKSSAENDVQVVLSTLKAIVGENRFATPITKLDSALAQRLGRPVDWKAFDCSSVSDFAKRMACGALELLKPHETHIVLRTEAWKPDTRSYSLSASDAAAPVFYPQSHTQKVVMVSDLPEEFRGEHDPEEHHRRYVEELLEDDLHVELEGEDPPHFRTESVEFHSAHHSYSQAEWFAAHAQTRSQEVTQFQSDPVLDTPPGYNV